MNEGNLKKENEKESKVDKISKVVEKEMEKEFIERLIKGKTIPPFVEEPYLIDSYDLAYQRIKEALESVMKFAQYYLRRCEARYGLRIEYAIAFRNNEWGLPVLVIEVLNFRFAEQLKKDLLKKAEELKKAEQKSGS